MQMIYIKMRLLIEFRRARIFFLKLFEKLKNPVFPVSRPTLFYVADAKSFLGIGLTIKKEFSKIINVRKKIITVINNY